MQIRFADCTLDLARAELLRRDRPVAVEPQVFALLRVLAEADGDLVDKETLVEKVWGGLAISDATIAARISAARKAVGDTGAAQAVIRTVPRRGVRLVVPVETPKPAAPAPAGLGPARIRYTRASDGTEIAWTTDGDGPPLLRIGHWMSHLEMDRTSAVWAPLLARLVARHSLIQYDMRGTGLSARDATLDGIAPYVDDLAAVVAAAGGGPFPLFAASQSVPIAIAYAAAHPETVSRLVLYGGYAQGRHHRPKSPGELDEDTALAMIAAGWGVSGSVFLESFARFFVPDATPDQIADLTDMQRETASPETAVALRKAIDRFDVTDRLAAIRVPTLVLHGRGDVVQPYAQGRRLAAGIPGAEFISLETRNHVPLPQDPAWEVLVEALLRFVAA